MATFEELYGPTQVALAKMMKADERKVLALYGKVLIECRRKIRKLYDTYAKDGKLDNADKSMANRLTQLQDEIQKIMDERLPGIIKCQAKLTGEMYEESFYRHCWCIDKSGTVGLDFGLLPKDAVDKAVKGTYDTFGRSRLLLDRTNAVRRLKEDIGLALIRGDSYQSLSAKIASHIGVDIEATKKVRYLHKGLSAWSMLVARTEGQRVIAEGQQAAYQKARDLGCDIEEVWDATLDARTRPEHAMLDQQVKDEEHGGWYVPRLSKYVPAPLHSGDPAFDLNCRCRVTARVKYLQDQSSSWSGFIGYAGWRQMQKAFNAVPPDNTGWKRKMRVFAETPSSAARKVNPNFTKGVEWQENCQRCVPAYEMRRRGYDIQAKPAPIVNGAFPPDDLAWGDNWQKPFKNMAVQHIPASVDPKDVISKQMKKWGDGARCEIRVIWKNVNYGHVFSAEQANGHTLFLDPQSGASGSKVEAWFNLVKKGEVYFARIDNLIPADIIKECCQKK